MALLALLVLSAPSPGLSFKRAQLAHTSQTTQEVRGSTKHGAQQQQIEMTLYERYSIDATFMQFRGDAVCSKPQCSVPYTALRLRGGEVPDMGITKLEVVLALLSLALLQLVAFIVGATKAASFKLALRTFPGAKEKEVEFALAGLEFFAFIVGARLAKAALFKPSWLPGAEADLRGFEAKLESCPVWLRLGILAGLILLASVFPRLHLLMDRHNGLFVGPLLFFEMARVLCYPFITCATGSH